MQTELLNKYGKYIAFIVVTFGGSALSLYARFQMTEIEIENLEKRLDKKIKVINKLQERVRELELKTVCK